MKPIALLVAVSVIMLAHIASAQAPPQRWLFDVGTTYPNTGSQPAVGYDNTVYFSCGDGALYAINPNGTLHWTFTEAGSGYSPAIGIDGTIYFASWHSNSLYAVNPDGTLKWKFATGDANASCPAIGADGTIYFVSTDGKFYALDPDGTKKWDYPVGYSTRPAAVGSDGTIYVGTGSFLFAFTPEGSRKWQYNCGNVGSAPSIDTNGVIYFIAMQSGNSSYVCALYPAGSLKWAYPLPGASQGQSAPGIDTNGNIYVCQYSTVFCIHPDGTTAWTVPLSVPDACAPAMCSDGTIIVGGNSFFFGLNPDGSVKWQYPVDQPCIRGATVSPNGDIFFGNARRVYSLAGAVAPAHSAWPMYMKTSRHTGRYDLESAGPPQISLQAVSQTAILNSTVYFSVVAGGTPPLSFQWYKGTNLLLGATNSFLRLQSVTLADAGVYTLTVSNCLGTTNTLPATLSVISGMQLDTYAGITIQGQVGATCQIQYCYDLSNSNNWTPLTNLTLPTATYFWVDPTPARSQKRFYRAFLTP